MNNLVRNPSNHETPASILANENGFVLVLAMLILVLLVVIGVTSMQNSTNELKIAGNEKFAKMAFFAADAGAQASTQILDEWLSQDCGVWDPLVRQNNSTNITFDCDITNSNKKTLGNNATTINSIIDFCAGSNTARTIGGASYSIAISSNTFDENNNLIQNNINSVKLTSTGTMTNGSSAIVEYTLTMIGDPCTYEQEHYDTANSGNANTNVNISGMTNQSDARLQIDESGHSYKD